MKSSENEDTGKASLVPDTLAYVEVSPRGRYFQTQDGLPFLVIGHNEAMSWPMLHGLHREPTKVAEYFQMLARSGVTVVRIMLEYCEDDDWYFEDSAGTPISRAVSYWDQLIHYAKISGVRLLIAFWDTYHMFLRWPHHPYSSQLPTAGCFFTDCGSPIFGPHGKGLTSIKWRAG